MFKAIFWDNDGVLMETEHLYYQANATVLAGAGVQLSLDEFRQISLCQGESVLALAAGCEAELRRQRDELYYRLLGEQAQVMPGVPETLARLHGKHTMAIVTSCRTLHFRQMHRESGLLGYFDFILTREDYAVSKPDPEPYLTACARAGVDPAHCLAIEDSVRGVLSAFRAGLCVAAVPGELNRGGDFSAARWVLSSIAQVAELVEGG